MMTPIVRQIVSVPTGQELGSVKQELFLAMLPAFLSEELSWMASFIIASVCVVDIFAKIR